MSGGAAVIESVGGHRPARAAGDPDRRGAVHGEHAERPRRQARRHRHRDERQDDRGEQHRRGGPPDPRGRPLLRRGTGRRADRGPGHAHRGDIVALGHTYAGLYANDDGWYDELAAAWRRHRRDLLAMPLHPEYSSWTKGKFADLTNASEAREASSNYAAEFLRQFVGDVAWVHMDVAGTAWGMSRPYVGKGASGFGTRALIELARRTAGERPRHRGHRRLPRLGRGGVPCALRHVRVVARHSPPTPGRVIRLREWVNRPGVPTPGAARGACATEDRAPVTGPAQAGRW